MDLNVLFRSELEKTSNTIFDVADVSDVAGQLAPANVYEMEFWERTIQAGLDVLLSDIQVHQPRVADVLSSGPGFVGVFDGKKAHLCLDVGSAIILPHPFSRLSDPFGSSAKPRQVEKYEMFPSAIRDSYYRRFCGMSILASDDLDRIVPWPVLMRGRDYWSPVDETLAAAGAKKSELPKLFEEMPDLKPEAGDIVRGLWTIMSSDWPISKGSGDAWTLHFRSEDRPSLAYLMQNFSVDGMTEVDDFVERIDVYLSKKMMLPNEKFML